MNEKRKKYLESVYLAIKDNSIVKNGQILPERELTDILGLSRQHLKEALLILDAFGVVDIRDRQGIFVAEQRTDISLGALVSRSAWPADVFAQVSEMRLLIEIPAAAMAAERRTTKDIERMREAIDVLNRLYVDSPPNMGEVGAQWNRILHSLVVSAAHNQLMGRIYECVSELVTSSISAMRLGEAALYPFEYWTEMILDEHVELVSAIDNGDKERARAAMEAHLNNSFSRIKGAE